MSLKNDNETTKISGKPVETYKGNSHKIKSKLQIYSLLFYFMEYNNLAITVQIWKELLSIFKILDVKRTLTRSVYEKLHSNFFIS